MNDTYLIGKRLDEYHILSQLGEGGMSAIYLGLDTRLHRYTAIKVIHAHLKNEPENVDRFNREARAVAGLDHPNIVRLYRYGQVDDMLYMAMQYIEGMDLRVVLSNYRQEGKLIPVADAVRITREICSALDYSHQRGVLHRDIKPSNIMLNREGVAILTDFGLALLPDVDTQGTAFGTPQYMAPEQAQSPLEVGPPSDLYAVGMVLYEMFTGEIPFHEVKNPMEMLALRATTPPPSPSAIQAQVNPELEAVILKALALNPAERYQSGAALTAALENSLPLVETVEEVTADEPPPVALSEMVEARPDPSLITTPAVEAASSPPTAVPIPDPIQAPIAASSSQRKFPRLPIPFIAVGGCLILLLFAVLILGNGVQFIREQLADKYQTWLPITMQENQEPPPANDAYPDPDLSNTDSSGEGPQENELPGSEVGRSLLQIATNGGDSFYLINIGNSPVALPALSFNDGSRVFDGSGWGISTLSPGECVSIWKDRGNPSAPNVDCNEVGSRVEMEPNEAFWKDSFDIIFQNTVVMTCPGNGCEFSVPNG